MTLIITAKNETFKRVLDIHFKNYSLFMPTEQAGNEFKFECGTRDFGRDLEVAIKKELIIYGTEFISFHHKNKSAQIDEKEVYKFKHPRCSLYNF